MKSFLFLSLLLTPLPALAQSKAPTWITVRKTDFGDFKPGTTGDILGMKWTSSDVDINSIVKSKGVTYFRWRYFISSKDNNLCKDVDSRICDGSGAAVKCSANQFLSNGKWVTMSKDTRSEYFIAAARFACDF